MLSAIDFGKSFLNSYFSRRDVDAAAGCCADDVIWITPNEIRHLRSAKSTRDFIVSSLEDDATAYNVDIAAVLSVPNLETANIIVFEINLIPKQKESAVNLRCALGLRQRREQYEIAYINMSRRYQRTDVEQIRSFADALPGGIMTLTTVNRDTALMFMSAFFCDRLGYEEAVLYRKADANPFFMMSEEEQRHMRTLVAEMSSLRKPKPLAMQVTLLHSDGSTQIPCHMTITAAYKEGEKTILYLTFDEIGDLLQEMDRSRRREQREWVAQKEKELRDRAPQAGQRAEGHTGFAVLSPDEMEREIEEIRRDCEKQVASVEIAANVRVEEAQKLAKDEADAAERLIRAKLGQAAQERKDAVEQERRRVSARYTEAWKKEKERQAQDRKMLEEALKTAGAAADAAIGENAALKEQARAAEEAHRLSDRQYEERIQQLEQELRDRAEEMRLLRETSEQAAAQRDEANAAAGRAETERAQLREQLQKAQSEAAAKENELSSLITRQQEKLREQELALRRNDTDRKMLVKEKDKSIRRLSVLLQSEMRGMLSTAAAAQEKEDPAELRKSLSRIAAAAEEIPALAEDLAAISGMDTSERRAYEEPFTISSCLNLARRVIRPQCREKGIIFSAGAASDMPDAVTGNKSGLELAFLCVLENAVNHTLSGGHITLNARADAPVRGSAYYHFTVADSGQGIAEDRLTVLFDDPSAELSIARRVIAAMGGSIQVRSAEGEGARFDIRVSLALRKTE